MVTSKAALHIEKQEEVMSKDCQHVWGIVLAGGEGKRLQAFIHTKYGTKVPKQYCAFTGTRSMLRHTIDRAEMLIPTERILTIVNKQHLYHTQHQLVDRPLGTVIVQPVLRETGIGILYPLLHVYQRDPEAIVCIFPSDHFVLNEQKFMEHIEFSSEYIVHHPQSLILIGVSPQQSAGAYGWIVTGEQTVHNNAKQVFRIERFVEKPDALIAGELYKKGSLWNTMIMVSTAKKLLALFKTFTPAVYQAFWNIRSILGSSLEASVIEKLYSTLSPMNFSSSILEKNPIGLCTLRMQGAYWSDWGDAARIRSDIQQFCTIKGVSAIPMPFVKESSAAAYARNIMKGYDVLGNATEEKVMKIKQNNEGSVS
jgi:mannose-1-phosphate guanylyltransferase